QSIAAGLIAVTLGGVTIFWAAHPANNSIASTTKSVVFMIQPPAPPPSRSCIVSCGCRAGEWDLPGRNGRSLLGTWYTIPLHRSVTDGQKPEAPAGFHSRGPAHGHGHGATGLAQPVAFAAHRQPGIC